MNGKLMCSPSICKHLNFDAAVRVVRLEDTGRFVAEVGIKCLECGTPFQFLGLQPGVNFDGATADLDGLEARLGICPKGQRPNPMQVLQGFTIKAHN